MAKTALVTGGSRGIGKACALALAKDGYNIIINYSSNTDAAEAAVNEIKALGVDAICIKADISKNDEVRSLFKKINETTKQLDVLVNNAGIVKDQYLLMLDSATTEKCVNTNLIGYIYCSQHATLKMFRKKSGCIINISSVSAEIALPGQVIYSATKGAINSMTHTSAKELASYGIRVNAVAPGFVKTEMLDVLDDEHIKKYIDNIPLGKFAAVEDVANVVSFLCSEKASYITGQVITVDGGLSL